MAKQEMGPRNQEQEKGPKYVLAIIESTDNEGIRRTYQPVIEERSNDYYQQTQCDFARKKEVDKNGKESSINIEGTLDEVMAEAKRLVEYDRKGNFDYLSVGVESPEELVARRPVDREFVLPKSQEEK